MKKILLMAAILCGASVFADDTIQYQMLYWQIGNGYAADQATSSRMYAVVDGGRINLGGSKTSSIGVINVSNFTSLGFDKTLAGYYFELLDGSGTILSTSQEFNYNDLWLAGAFDVTYGSLGGGATMTAPITHSAPFTAYTMIPEPTSGLLMLLGFAGIALKRKRA